MDCWPTAPRYVQRPQNWNKFDQSFTEKSIWRRWLFILLEPPFWEVGSFPTRTGQNLPHLGTADWRSPARLPRHWKIRGGGSEKSALLPRPARGFFPWRDPSMAGGRTCKWKVSHISSWWSERALTKHVRMNQDEQQAREAFFFF